MHHRQTHAHVQHRATATATIAATTETARKAKQNTMTTPKTHGRRQATATTTETATKATTPMTPTTTKTNITDRNLCHSINNDGDDDVDQCHGRLQPLQRQQHVQGPQTVARERSQAVGDASAQDIGGASTLANVASSKDDKCKHGRPLPAPPPK